MICSVFPHLAHDALRRVVSKVPSRRLERGEGPQAPVLLPSEQVVNLPGHPSRQAPPAAAGAQTRRACFRGFNPQVSGLSSAVAESPAAGAAHVAAASRTPPPPRQRSPHPAPSHARRKGGTPPAPSTGSTLGRRGPAALA